MQNASSDKHPQSKAKTYKLSYFQVETFGTFLKSILRNFRPIKNYDENRTIFSGDIIL